jgi:hypothetical protein
MNGRQYLFKTDSFFTPELQGVYLAKSHAGYRPMDWNFTLNRELQTKREFINKASLLKMFWTNDMYPYPEGCEVTIDFSISQAYTTDMENGTSPVRRHNYKIQKVLQIPVGAYELWQFDPKIISRDLQKNYFTGVFEAVSQTMGERWPKYTRREAYNTYPRQQPYFFWDFDAQTWAFSPRMVIFMFEWVNNFTDDTGAIYHLSNDYVNGWADIKATMTINNKTLARMMGYYSNIAYKIASIEYYADMTVTGGIAREVKDAECVHPLWFAEDYLTNRILLVKIDQAGGTNVVQNFDCPVYTDDVLAIVTNNLEPSAWSIHQQDNSYECELSSGLSLTTIGLRVTNDLGDVMYMRGTVVFFIQIKQAYNNGTELPSPYINREKQIAMTS